MCVNNDTLKHKLSKKVLMLRCTQRTDALLLNGARLFAEAHISQNEQRVFITVQQLCVHFSLCPSFAL